MKYAAFALALGCGGASGAADSANSQATQAAPAVNPSRDGAAGGGRASAARPVNARGRILFIGTSLTAGYGLEPDSAYPQLIQRKLDSAGLRYDAINAGVSGETSSALRRRLDWLLRQHFDVVVIETGANDGLRGIPVQTMEANVRAIVQRVREARPEARVMLVQMEAPPNMGADYTRRFRAVFPAVAKDEGVTLLPFLLEGVAGERELNQADGIHPNYAGERIVAENVWRALRPLLP